MQEVLGLSPKGQIEVGDEARREVLILDCLIDKNVSGMFCI